MGKKIKIDPIDLEMVYLNLDNASQKAAFALSNLTEQYFACYTPSEDAFKIQCAFSEAAIYCDIAEDYILMLQNQLNKLKKITYSNLQDRQGGCK